jgi:uncharacterized membrane protein
VYLQVKIWFQNRRARERRERDGKCPQVSKSGSISKNNSENSNDSISSLSDGSGTKNEIGGGRPPWYTPIPPTTTAMTQFNNAVQNGTSAFSPVTLNI